MPLSVSANGHVNLEVRINGKDQEQVRREGEELLADVKRGKASRVAEMGLRAVQRQRQRELEEATVEHVEKNCGSARRHRLASRLKLLLLLLLVLLLLLTRLPPS
jgi:hypothetical protein